MEIIDATKNDASKIKELINLGVKQEYILNRTSIEINKLIKKGHLVVVKDEGLIIGLACLDYYSLRLSELRTVYILEEYRGKGVGKKLIDSIVKKAKELGVNELMTITTKEKKEWFSNAGFVEEINSFKIPLFKKLD